MGEQFKQPLVLMLVFVYLSFQFEGLYLCLHQHKQLQGTHTPYLYVQIDGQLPLNFIATYHKPHSNIANYFAKHQNNPTVHMQTL